MRRYARVMLQVRSCPGWECELTCAVPGAWRFARVAVAAAICALGIAGAPEVQAQQASVTGAVLLDGNDKPLANAEILLTDLNVSTRSNSEGKFLLTGLPAGKHSLVVRLVGYESFTADITLSATQKLDADYLLTPISTKLGKVDVKAIASSPYSVKLADFDERRKAGIGKFLTADVFEKEDGRPASSFVRAHIAGLNVIQFNGARFLVSARGKPLNPPGADLGAPRECYMQIVVNGRIEYNGSGQRLYDFDLLNTKDIIGLEFYTVATTPLQYQNSGPATPCGTVIIWTKGG